MKPYSIYTPPFDVTSGGIRVMWGLYGWLLAKGQIAYVNAKYENPNFVAVYPEIVKGNPTEAKTVVRYILAPPGEMMGSIDKPEEGDIVYSFSKFIYKVDDDHTMFLPILNTHLFKDQKRKRTKTCVIVGKGIDTNLHPDNAIYIDRILAQDQQALADLLNECHVMYCYDYRTAMTEIARLCGCRVVIIPSKFTKEEFAEYEPGMNGISWGDKEEVKLDTEAFRDHYLSLIKTFEKKLDLFIGETQK